MIIKKFVFTLAALALCVSARADDTVLNTYDPNLLSGNFGANTTGFVAGHYIAESFVSGTNLLTLSNVVFPQIYQTNNDGDMENFDGYSTTETFGLYTNLNTDTTGTNPPGSNKPGVLLFNFTLQNDPNIDARINPGTFGETTASVPLGAATLGFSTLSANTRYWLVLMDAVGSPSWSFKDSTAYTAANGYLLPDTDTIITDEDNGTIYNLNDPSGPQQFALNAVPEPSTYGLMAVAGLILVVSRKRTSKLA